MSTKVVHIPAGVLPSGQRVRAVCSCGWATTPRADERRAYEALERLHEFPTARCELCGRDRLDPDATWRDRYRRLRIYTDPDGGEQFLACNDELTTCRELAAQRQVHLDRAAFDALGIQAPPPRLRVRAGGRADLLAEVAGTLRGSASVSGERVTWYIRERQILLLLDAGADTEQIPRWFGEGARRASRPWPTI